MRIIIYLSSFLFTSLAYTQQVTTLVNDPVNTFEAIHWHEDGRIYSVDFNNGRVLQIFLDGTVETLVTGIASPAGGGFGSDGRFYYSALASGEVYRLEEDGTTTLITTGLNQPTGITQVHPDTLLVGQYGNNSIAKVAIGSGMARVWVNGGGISGPDGIIPYENGAHLVANFNNTQIHTVDADGTISDFATLPENGFMGYLTQIGDDVYVPAISAHKIYRVTDDGTASILVGTSSAGHVDGDVTTARFTQPNGIVGSPNGDTLLVADGNRVRMITDLQGSSVNTETVTPFEQIRINIQPTRDVLSIHFSLSKASQLRATIYQRDGRLVKTAATTFYPEGQHQMNVDVSQLANGIYVVRIANTEGLQEALTFYKVY